MQTVERTGVIHDIGYQRYTGARLGRGYAVRSLYTHSLRSAFGLGRSAKAKIFPWFVIAILLLIAVISVVISTFAPSGELGVSYINFAANAGLLSGLFLCSAAPELLSRDLRSKVLSLYFSRPITRSDYALAKLAAAVTAAFILLGGPITFMFVAHSFSLDHVSDVWPELGDYVSGLSVAAIYAIVYGSIAAVLSSLFNRRVVAAAVIIGYFLLTAAVIGVVGGITGGAGTAFHIALVVNPAAMLRGLTAWLYGNNNDDFQPDQFGLWYLIATLGTVLVSIGALLLRYRKVEA